VDKTILVADACHEVKLSDDLYDVEKFLEASETVVKNRIKNGVDDKSLVILKRAEADLMFLRENIIEVIYNININKPQPPENIFPECKEKPVATCKDKIIKIDPTSSTPKISPTKNPAQHGVFNINMKGMGYAIYHAVWGTCGPDGKDELNYVRLIDCSTDHLKNILKYSSASITPDYHTIIYEILNSRKVR